MCSVMLLCMASLLGKLFFNERVIIFEEGELVTIDANS